MSRPTKFNPVIKYSIIELYKEGLSHSKIALHCNVSLRTLQYWIKRYELLPLMESAREDHAKECIEAGLFKLAKGSSDISTKEKFIYYRRATRIVIDEDTGEEREVEYLQPVEKTVNKVEKAPDVKAIEVLSRKYAKEFDSKAEERELTGKLLEGFTMRDLQESLKDNPIDAGKFIEAEYIEVIRDSDSGKSS